MATVQHWFSLYPSSSTLSLHPTLPVRAHPAQSPPSSAFLNSLGHVPGGRGSSDDASTAQQPGGFCKKPQPEAGWEDKVQDPSADGKW